MNSISVTLFAAGILVCTSTGLSAADTGPNPPPVQTYREAPILAERVARGELPPVEERLPENPYVLTPYYEIGVYGGTIRRGLRSETDDFTGINKTLSESLFGYTRPFPSGIELNMAESHEFRDEGRELIVHLRRGMRWSDGHPFTAGDVLFWYQDMLMDESARAQAFFPTAWLIHGEPIQMEALDDYTLRVFAPYPMGQVLNAFAYQDMCAYPRHYYARYHPRYNPEATYVDFRRRTTRMRLAMDPGVPSLRAWKPVQWIRGQRVVYERNPYYWKVDPEGNQLPYADRLTFTFVQDPRLIHLKFMNGEFDLFGRYGGSLIYPTLQTRRHEGNYRVMLAEPGRAQLFFLNWDAPDPNLRQAMRDLRFRQALSHAINREEIRDAIYYGVLLRPTGYGFSRLNPWYKEEDYMRYTEYDPDLARRLLDEADLIDRNGDGFRQYPDGSRVSITIDYIGGREESDMVEFVAGYWEDVGIRVFLNMGLGNVIYWRRHSGTFEAFRGMANGAEDPFSRLIEWGILTSQNPWWHRNAFEEGPDWLRRGTELLLESMTIMDTEALADNMVEIRETYSKMVPNIAVGELMIVWGASNRLGNISDQVVTSDVYRGWGRPVGHEQLFFRPEAK